VVKGEDVIPEETSMIQAQEEVIEDELAGDVI
jgi:hypothetical protein